MPERNVVEAFFDELSRREPDPQLNKLSGTGRFEILDDNCTEEWLVTVEDGHFIVSRAGGEADWVMRGTRDAFAGVIQGDAGVLAAFVRGSLSLITKNPPRFKLLTHLFAGPPESYTPSRDEDGRGPSYE